MSIRRAAVGHTYWAKPIKIRLDTPQQVPFAVLAAAPRRGYHKLQAERHAVGG